MALQEYVASQYYLLESFNSFSDAWPFFNFDLPWLLPCYLVPVHNKSTGANQEVYKVLDKISKNFQYRLQHHEYPDHEWMYVVGVLFSLTNSSRFTCSDAAPSRHMVNVLVSRILLTRSALPQSLQKHYGFVNLFMRRFNEAGLLDVNRKHLVIKSTNSKPNWKANVHRTSADLYNQDS